MIQLFLIIAFVLGFAIGWKVYEFVIMSGLAFLANQENSGVVLSEDGNKITINSNILQNFKLNKENIN